MLSVNLPLRRAYFAGLGNITYESVPVKVFWQQLPTTISPGIYIIFGPIRSNDDSLKTSPVTQTSVTVSVYTNMPKYNDGVAVEVVTNEVMNRICPTTRFNLSLDQFLQVLTTNITSDITNDLSQDQQNVYVERILIFSHTIFQNPS